MSQTLEAVSMPCADATITNVLVTAEKVDARDIFIPLTRQG